MPSRTRGSRREPCCPLAFAFRRGTRYEGGRHHRHPARRPLSALSRGPSPAALPPHLTHPSLPSGLLPLPRYVTHAGLVPRGAHARGGPATLCQPRASRHGRDQGDGGRGEKMAAGHVTGGRAGGGRWRRGAAPRPSLGSAWGGRRHAERHQHGEGEGPGGGRVPHPRAQGAVGGGRALERVMGRC